MEPPAVRGAVKRPFELVGLGVETTCRFPPSPVVADAVIGGNWVRMEAGTVKVPGPAVVKQRNDQLSVTRLAPEPVVVAEEPPISTISVGLPPVQLSVRPALRLIVVGSPPVRVSGEPTVNDPLKAPTSLPPAPASV